MLTSDTDPTLIAAELLKAIQSGNAALIAVLAVLGLTILAKRVLAKRWPGLNSVAGATAIALLGSVGGAVATALIAGEALTLALISKAALVAICALLPSAATVKAAEAKGDAAAAKVDSVDAAIEEMNK